MDEKPRIPMDIVIGRQLEARNAKRPVDRVKRRRDIRLLVHSHPEGVTKMQVKAALGLTEAQYANTMKDVRDIAFDYSRKLWVPAAERKVRE